MKSDKQDQLQRWLFEDINARCVHVALDGVLSSALGERDYPPTVTRLLSQALLLVSLMSSGIKLNGRISLQIQSASSGVRLLLADCTDDGGLRCVARLNDEVPLPASDDAVWQSLVGDGIMTLTLEPEHHGERWQGIVPIEGAGLAEAMENFFVRSEQLPTRVRIAIDADQASALMIQRMPGPSEDADGWNRLNQLLETLTQDELVQHSGSELVTRLFHQEDRRQFPERELRFHCPCSRRRVADVLTSLGSDEIEAMAAEGEVVNVQCEFCGEDYNFDPIQLLELLNEGSTAPSPTLH